ncbi:MAG: PQQ-binding-like beta-propeller repeat protein, partial [Armatimonadota bacterium]
WVIAYDPLTGREYWRVNCVDGDSAPSPIYANGHIYVANIYASLVAIRPGGEGDVTDTHVSWSAEGSLPDICSPLSDGELVFVLSTNGIFSCYDAEDGALLWSEKLGRRFRSSPSLVGKRVYLLSETGESIVAAAARGYRQLATGQLGEAAYSSPAFAAGRMYIRGERHLYCMGQE